MILVFSHMPRFSQKRSRSSTYIGRSNRRKYTRTPYTRRRRGTRYGGKSKVMRNIAFNLAESKHRNMALKFTGGTGAYSWNGYHDNLYACHLHNAPTSNGLLNMNIGAGDSSHRIGREIYTTGFRVRGSFGVPHDRRNLRIKMWLAEYNSIQGDITTYTDFFENTVGNGMVDPVNNDRFGHVRKLRDLRVTSRDLQDASGTATIYYDIWIPFKRKLGYPNGDTNGVNPMTGVKEMLSLVMLPYDTVGSSSVNDIIVWEHEQCITLYYRDP